MVFNGAGDTTGIEDGTSGFSARLNRSIFMQFAMLTYILAACSWAAIYQSVVYFGRPAATSNFTNWWFPIFPGPMAGCEVALCQHQAALLRDTWLAALSRFPKTRSGNMVEHGSTVSGILLQIAIGKETGSKGQDCRRCGTDPFRGSFPDPGLFNHHLVGRQGC